MLGPAVLNPRGLLCQGLLLHAGREQDLRGALERPELLALCRTVLAGFPECSGRGSGGGGGVSGNVSSSGGGGQGAGGKVAAAAESVTKGVAAVGVTNGVGRDHQRTTEPVVTKAGGGRSQGGGGSSQSGSDGEGEQEEEEGGGVPVGPGAGKRGEADLGALAAAAKARGNTAFSTQVW